MKTIENLKKDVGFYALVFLGLLFVGWFIGVVKIISSVFIW